MQEGPSPKSARACTLQFADAWGVRESGWLEIQADKKVQPHHFLEEKIAAQRN